MKTTKTYFPLLVLLFVTSGPVWAQQQEWLACPGSTDCVYTMADRVGIGTSNPNSSGVAKLSVLGKVRSTHVQPSFTVVETDASNQGWSLVGIGGEFRIRDLTAGSVYPLRIEPGQSQNDVLWLDNTGKVGMGTTTPAERLSVSGIVHSDQGGFRFPDDSVQTTAAHGDGHSLDAANGSFTDALLVDDAGRVGIGTLNPQSKLAVNGTITAQEVVVTLSGWPDYVFEDDYDLMSLDELEASIRSEGHLPGIPSAKDVAQHGVSVGQFNAKLLQKVEELTLYMIELKKENDEIRSQLQALAKAE